MFIFFSIETSFSYFIFKMFLMMFHLNLICCHLLNLLPFPLQELVAGWRRNEISLSSMNFTEYVNAATFPIQISYMGISLGKGNAASFTHLVNAIQQPVYPFFHNALYILFLLTCRSMNSDGKEYSDVHLLLLHC